MVKNLFGINLQDAIISGVNLSNSNLSQADFSRADMRGVRLTGADLRGARLISSILSDIKGGRGNSIVDITDADFSDSVMGWTIIGHIYLNRIIGIGNIKHIGPSYVSTSTLELTAIEIQKKWGFTDRYRRISSRLWNSIRLLNTI